MNPDSRPSAIPEPVWLLRGFTGRPLECSVSTAPSTLWFVTVKYGPETMLNESYPSLGAAMSRAISLKEAMMANGWSSPATS